MYEPILSEKVGEKWIEICAWCDVDKTVTKRYICEGYKASHGICYQHKEAVIKETIEFYESKGFGIASDDITNTDGVQHNPDYDI